MGITLFVSTQGCGKPQEADEQKVDTHAFYCVVKIEPNINLILGIIGVNSYDMAREKLTMTKCDVLIAISDQLIKNYKSMNIIGRYKPDFIQNVLATIQDRDYKGAGKYNVLLDIYGNEIDKYGNRKENIHYTTQCSVYIKSDSENSPIVSFPEPLCFTKQYN